MAEKKEPMGDDPLSWLADDEKQAKEKPEAKTPSKRKRVRRSTATKKAVKIKTEAEYLQESFTALSSEGEAIAKRFYERLFDIYPETHKLFEGVSVSGQEKKLLASLVLLVQNIQKPDVLNEYLTGLGARHMHYGVVAEDFPKVAENLLAVLEEFAGELWTTEVSVAWENTLNNVAKIMLDAYEPLEAEPMTTTESITESTDMENRIFELESQIEAINKSMGVIHFTPEGLITDVNDNFLAVVGYTREQVVGQHHRMFAEPALAASQDYADFWAKLKRGEFDAGEYKRIGNGGKEIWLEASYNPIFDENGVVVSVTKFASEITEKKKAAVDADGQISAIDKVMGVISFKLDGTIIDINDNFLAVVGYSREEVIGKHHRMFAPPGVAESQGYADFWAKLGRGEFDAGQYERVGKSGKEIWLEASYNPILDVNGNPYKVIKYATDITEQKQLQNTVERIQSEVSRVMNAMAAGSLQETINGEYDGEFANLQKAVNTTVHKMAETVTEISETAVTISSSATEISRGNTDLSSRTEQQASSLEETASSMEELTSTVRQNSDNAAQANQLAASAREQAEKGGSVIKEAIEAMTAISSASKKVADIIGVIDEIAFQTNLLALNAAVEAARAGEQGRGFAVVASEVRNLAQRSAGAAKEIKELINDSGEKVKEGSMLVDESGRTLEDIVAGAKRVGDIISEIAAAGAEQTSGITQVNLAVGQMDEMTQQNAALVEEAAAASESLDQQGQVLQRLVSFFDTGVTVSAPPSQIPAPVMTAAQSVATPTPMPQANAASVASTDDDEWDEF